jgi:hypothetical protein
MSVYESRDLFFVDNILCFGLFDLGRLCGYRLHNICSTSAAISQETTSSHSTRNIIIYGQTCIVVTTLEMASAALEQHMTNPPAHHSHHSQGNAKVSRSSGNVGFHTRETRLCNVTTFTAKCKIGPVPSFGAEGSSSNSLIVAGYLQHPLLANSRHFQ